MVLNRRKDVLVFLLKVPASFRKITIHSLRKSPESQNMFEAPALILALTNVQKLTSLYF